MVDYLEMKKGFTEDVAAMRREFDERVEIHAKNVEWFAAKHSLWAVAPEKLIGLYANYIYNEVQESMSRGEQGEG